MAYRPSKLEIKERGWISPLIIKVGYGWYWYLSIVNLNCIGERLIWLKRRFRSHTEEEYCPRSPGYIFTDTCVAISFILVVSSFFWITSVYFIRSCGWITILNVASVVFIVYRLIDIILVWLYVHLIARSEKVKVLDKVGTDISKVREPTPLRSIILVTINFIEVVIIFAIISFLVNPYISSRWLSLRYSIGVITTLGLSLEPQNLPSQFLFAFELIYGLFFILIVIQRALQLFRLKD